MRRLRAMSAVEMLVAITIVAVATGAVARAYSASLDYQTNSSRASDAADARVHFEDRMSELIRGATLRGTNMAFISPISKSASGAQLTTPNSILADGSSSLMLTSLYDPIPVRYRTSTITTFEDLNQTFGPQVGAAEIAFSLIPVGDAGIKQGLFLREQRPPDSDATQGGKEFDFNPEVQDIRFEFYDGTQWQTAWDSTTDTEKGKLPVAVRVTYVVRGDHQPHTFLVRLQITGGGGATS